MDDSAETQEKVIVEQVPDRQLLREQDVDRRLDELTTKVANQPTKEEFDKAIEGLANKADVAKLNNYVHSFLLGVQVLEKSSKWVLYAIIFIGGLAGGLLIIKNGFVLILGWLGFTKM